MINDDEHTGPDILRVSNPVISPYQAVLLSTSVEEKLPLVIFKKNACTVSYRLDLCFPSSKQSDWLL